MADLTFTLTPGTPGGGINGYGNGGASSSGSIGSFGSIDVEPLSGQTLNYFFTGPFSGIIFAGNVTSQLAGRVVSIGGVDYPFDSQDWTYNGGSNTTEAYWDAGAPTLSVGVPVLVTLKDPPPPPPGLTYVAASTSTSATISLPTGAAAGDVVFLAQAGRNTATAAPANTLPGTWTDGGLTSSNTSPVFAGIGLGYKVLDSGDISAGSITGMDGNDYDRKVMFCYRPDSGYEITGVTMGTAAGTIATGNPSAQNIGGSGGTPPVVIIGAALQESGDTVSFSTETPAFDAKQTGGANNFLVGRKLYNSSPADHTIDIGDSGAYNALRGRYFAVTISPVSSGGTVPLTVHHRKMQKAA